ncbi:alanine racemase [Candidatus Uhrbacteria bacterium CG_4_9_14_0_2_um_filter_41_50]|uniref:Alanine racemase n=1 Tax=Candidatus Uhrbacteria bacterium CG_4_9_14_0_2_um_filter_41_50 TaxID=1975031 RepID=A0A2M8EP24_9BACT|nr:MAG: alanine racemase [Candidatus Uhrbacteria bacterium CG_4_10_14_3_um_filter_41_21]PIZ54380.1 MAG: alanine racemase [Candidatus Uhrbacteria bacterium CG_4_10_14_0_2_um_filter_41_21]PJB84978.1 MAG: alanine racemase [Candidatus Uhrbacteria bacterium CG_4_9_14_0_8_um_filter_41_16]PJC24485.1 MAG: alanine racemase [Candidatus Uhrbacteria bacterium CG_4_9_14_0_2_um_filter_41_50]PJE74711.1 MAG: alanine racemase [Candidatus Uhrbacteria bacterium CG10_big_fil_rev_8_21_14_0_10_41_26]
MKLHGAKTWVEISASAYKNNLNVLKSLLEHGVTFCAVVKAGAYGHGLAEIVGIAKYEGVDHFAVDNIDEAIQVRQLVPEAIIFILGYTVPERLKDVISGNFIQTVYQNETIQILGREATNQNRQALINIKIETGTQRQGIEIKDLKILLATIEKEYGTVECVGLSSHFSSSEMLEKEAFTKNQNKIFNEAIEITRRFGFNPKYIHISCSASGFLFPETHHTMVRFGLSQYGMWSSEDVKKKMLLGAKNVELQSVLSWKTRIAQVKDIEPNTPVGYSQRFVSDRPMRIAILPVGYFDGYRRALNNSFVLLHGQKCKILGNICMNMMIIDVSSVGQAKADDEVTLIGRDGMNQITADDLATNCGTINYEITTMINPFITRKVI